MDSSNYTLFEILKYKIEFLECLEYSLTTYTVNEDDIKKRLTLLRSDLKQGLYKEIVSTLFTAFNKLNNPLKKFLKAYTYKKIIKINNSKKVKHLIDYNEKLIDAYETFTYIINAFLEEEQIAKVLDKKITKLITLNNEHFINFMFFNCYTIYLETVYSEDTKYTYSEKDITRTITLLSYCNKNNQFDSYIETLKNDDKDNIYNQLEKLSNNCVKLEKEQDALLKEIINTINNEIHK